jgi:hypothetical protein
MLRQCCASPSNQLSPDSTGFNAEQLGLKDFGALAAKTPDSLALFSSVAGFES